LREPIVNLHSGRCRRCTAYRQVPNHGKDKEAGEKYTYGGKLKIARREDDSVGDERMSNGDYFMQGKEVVKGTGFVRVDVSTIYHHIEPISWMKIDLCQKKKT
jgi:hypothetical protein